MPGQPHAPVLSLPVGQGRLIWSPLPVELAESAEPTVALYRYALAQASIEPLFDLDDDDPGLLVYPARYRGSTLYAVLSERGSPTTVRLTDRQRQAVLGLTAPALRGQLARLKRRVGGPISTLPATAWPERVISAGAASYGALVLRPY